MDTYTDKLAPWEKRSAYYKDVKLGKKVDGIKNTLKNQTEKMIESQIASADEIVASQGIVEDALKEINYSIKRVGHGMGGLMAAFEWGISDVVWLIEKNTEEMHEVMMDIYQVPDRQMEGLRHKADDAFARGDMKIALERFTELESVIKNDFSIYLNLGMIHLFHKIDKEKALAYFDKAIKYVRLHSTYYTSYALLYKALIKRDFGLIEEAEQCSSEAINLSPGLTEAKYQNAQYNALLNRPEKAIPMLRKVINNDIVYCLRILWEQDFGQISSEIVELYEEIRKGKYEEINKVLETENKEVILLANAIKGIDKLGYGVPEEVSVELLLEGRDEIDKLVQNNSIIDAYIAGIQLPLLSKKRERQKELLRRKGNEIYLNLDRKIEELNEGVAGKKKKGGTVPFIIYFLCGQIVAFPFGWYIGMPLGICITEGLLFAICFYINVIQPQSQWKEVSTKKNEQDKLLKVIEKL